MEVTSFEFLRSSPRLVNAIEWQLAAVMVVILVVKWIRKYTLRLNVRRAGVVLSVSFFFLVCYYVFHLEKHPITNRARFVAYSPQEFEQRVSGDVELIQRYFWPMSRKPSKSPNYRKLLRVSAALLRANDDLPGVANKSWSFVIVRYAIPSAFVLPNRRTYVFDGLFKVCDNDDSLSFVVAHELSHCLLHHSLEKESLGLFLDTLNTLVWASCIFLVRGEVMATLVPWLVSRALYYGVFLPQSRYNEIEADSLALQMLSRACFDFRYSLVYFDKAVATRTRVGTRRMKKLISSTHPTRKQRVRSLFRQMDTAMRLRRARNCSALIPLRKRDENRIQALIRYAGFKTREN